MSTSTTGESRAVVSAATPEASAAGAEILASGGNAIDAAVAVSLALGVTEPAGSGIGGQGTMIIKLPGEPAEVINGTSFAPSVIPEEVSSTDLMGLRASTVPSLLRTLDFAWKTRGSGRVSWRQVMEPSIRLAVEGFPLGRFRHLALARHASAIRHHETAAKLLLEPNGSIPKEGSLIRFSSLGRTLERLAAEGADDFYGGNLAWSIAEDMKRRNGWITADDLASVPNPRVIPPVAGIYRGWEVSTLPPPAAGWVVLLGLNLLERAPAEHLSRDGAERLVWLARALEIAHRRRAARPVRDLVDYEEGVASRIDKSRAERLLRAHRRGPVGETTHFSLVDDEGTVVAMTQSLNAYFGAKVAHPTLGFLYNDYMHEFTLTNGRHPFSLRPRAMPYSSMSSSILSRDGVPALALGSPGDSRIISAVVQVISHWVDLGQGIEAAVAAPRIHSLGADELLLEAEPSSPRALLRLEEQGYTVYRPLSSLFTGALNPYFGGVHAVARENDQWQGSADPRRDGAVSRGGTMPR